MLNIADSYLKNHNDALRVFGGQSSREDSKKKATKAVSSVQDLFIMKSKDLH